jgi:anti-sigma-K factor RskA
MSSVHTDDMLEMAALYALDAVDASECAAVRAHIMECDRCKAEYGAAKASLSGLAASVAVPPPPALREKVLSAALARPKPRNVIPIFRRKRFYAAIVAVAAAVAAVVMFRSPSGQSWPLGCYPATSACTASGRVIAAGGVLRLEASGLTALPSGKIYQAWIIQPGGKPVPEPTFSVDSNGRGSVEVPSGQPKGTIVAVTVEPAGGSQSPTTKPFIAATLD